VRQISQPAENKGWWGGWGAEGGHRHPTMHDGSNLLMAKAAQGELSTNASFPLVTGAVHIQRVPTRWGHGTEMLASDESETHV
jgi:hypothetical protein